MKEKQINLLFSFPHQNYVKVVQKTWELRDDWKKKYGIKVDLEILT